MTWNSFLYVLAVLDSTLDLEFNWSQWKCMIMKIQMLVISVKWQMDCYEIENIQLIECALVPVKCDQDTF